MSCAFKSSFGNVNGDVKKFLYYFLPKGQTLTRQNLNPVVRHLHLAFKEMETEERYDVLIEQMVRAINQYDPTYTEKVKLVVEAINNELNASRSLRRRSSSMRTKSAHSRTASEPSKPRHSRRQRWLLSPLRRRL